ncbi:aryl-alcohol dehydrogenase-like predicted oxidoreductase [Hasllibacter halocynthiae]|uniref:Aryl-alcohol dehydrogenase-like predicted oxidoreductase n=1 Tax=Hasllibacter halocynthiae TaxID=595589 RepID=A0A2T0X9G3_9RHOB|nr:aldo/keto reductase [Hasllibacter halocynthiae]PRY95591.1 aryl-alcohol dehydrogenase-like predicted oxidoreductase [Hasllibacter halocynthiae]
MKRTTLGRSGIDVSALCLGTMTWGTQTPPEDAHEQIDACLGHGIDFLDTAEMYPVNPVRKETVGRTEAIVGDWIRRTGRRDELVIATKCSGENGSFVREGRMVDGDVIREALDGSLRRLRTDRVDLYQLHWPNRGSYHFRQYWDYDPSGQPPKAEVDDNIADCLEALDEAKKAGKIRAWGLSNESAWGTTRWLAQAEAGRGPRVEAIQNEYSLMDRRYDTDLAELGHQEGVTLLAFSPLACGFLTGKYAGGAKPEGSRAAINDGLGGRFTDSALAAAAAYVALAREIGMEPVHLALRFCLTRPFPCIPIFGATTIEQLRTILDCSDDPLPNEVMDRIDAVHRAHPMPY